MTNLTDVADVQQGIEMIHLAGCAHNNTNQQEKDALNDALRIWCTRSRVA